MLMPYKGSDLDNLSSASLKKEIFSSFPYKFTILLLILYPTGWRGQVWSNETLLTIGISAAFQTISLSKEVYNHVHPCAPFSLSSSSFCGIPIWLAKYRVCNRYRANFLIQPWLCSWLEKEQNGLIREQRASCRHNFLFIIFCWTFLSIKVRKKNYIHP